MQEMELIIITGLSGAGKTTALRALEDMNFYCVDNLPPALMSTFTDLCAQAGDNVRRAALVIDIRTGTFFDSLVTSLDEIEAAGISYRIIYLEASDDVLVRRFKETRRRHPMAQGRVLDSIVAERKVLEPIRGRASLILNTSELRPRELRERLQAELSTDDKRQGRMNINLVSFGYKHGLPLDADLALDVRFLPNPHYVPSLQPLTGEHPEVADYVLKWGATQQLLERLHNLLEFLIPHYVREGKSQVTVAIGCTGGQHRSVVLVRELADWLRTQGYDVFVQHRDVDRRDQAALEQPSGGREDRDEPQISAGSGGG